VDGTANGLWEAAERGRVWPVATQVGRRNEEEGRGSIGRAGEELSDEEVREKNEKEEEGKT
jgi:hypothetical protein